MPQQQQQQQPDSDQQRPCRPPPLPAPQPEPSDPAPQPEPSDPAPQPKPSSPAPQRELSHLAPQPESLCPAPQPGPSRPAPVAGINVGASPVLEMDMNLPRVLKLGVRSFSPGKPSHDLAITAGLNLTISAAKQLYQEKRNENMGGQSHATNKRPKINEEPQQDTVTQGNRSIPLQVSRIACNEISVAGQKGLLMTVNWCNASGDAKSTVKTTTRDVAVQTSDELQSTQNANRSHKESNLQPSAKDADDDESERDF